MKKHLPQLIILCLIIAIAWHKILFQSLMGEGFFYFKHGAKETDFPDIVLRFDTGPRLLFDLFKVTFKDMIFYYQLLAFLTLIALSIQFYFLVYELTRKKFIAAFASLFFSVNFVGLFEMFAIGNYQFFIGRAIFFLLLFPSFIFFVRYVDANRVYNLVLSLLLYTLSFMLSQFSMFFLPLFLTYAIAFLVIKKRIYKCLLLYLLLTFILLYLDILYGSGSLIKGQNFFNFLVTEKHILIQQLLHQLTVLFIPDEGIKFISKYYQTPVRDMIKFFYIPTLIGYISLTKYLFRKEDKLRISILAASLFIPIVFLLNSYTRGTDFIGRIESGSRYLFVPSIASSIIWAMFFYSLFSIRIFFLKVFVVLLVPFYTYQTTNTIWWEIEKDFYKHVAAKKSFEYIKSISSYFSEDSFVIVPSAIGFHGSEFSQIFYGKAHTTFVPFGSDWQKMLKRPFNPKKDFILEYDYENEKVVNKTNEYEVLIKKKKGASY